MKYAGRYQNDCNVRVYTGPAFVSRRKARCALPQPEAAVSAWPWHAEHCGSLQPWAALSFIK
jgi:hypothetical protein